jgi:hypothetical protein
MTLVKREDRRCVINAAVCLSQTCAADRAAHVRNGGAN